MPEKAGIFLEPIQNRHRKIDSPSELHPDSGSTFSFEKFAVGRLRGREKKSMSGTNPLVRRSQYVFAGFVLPACSRSGQ